MGRGSAGRGRRPQRTGRHQARAKQQKRQTARAGRPLPKPRKASQAAANRRANRMREQSNEEQEELQSEFDALMDEFSALDTRAELGEVYDEIGRIEGLFTNLPALLDDLRVRGFVHGGGLEERLDALDEEWDESVRPRVDELLQSTVSRLDREVDQLERRIKPGRLSESVLSVIESAIERAEAAVETAEENLAAIYEGIADGLDEVEEMIDDAEWMVEQIEESSDIHLLEAEGPLMAVEAEWEEDGEDEGPDGILYLTDQRLLFEQKEKVAKKKFLFVTTKSEMVQKLLLDVAVRDIESAEHSEEKRGFLGMRGDDILQMVLAPTADHARLRFHLKGQEAVEWTSMIKRVRSGDIDKDRAEEFVDEMEEAATATLSLPTQCPTCYAPVPPQPRGITSLVCDFCGGTVAAS